jgi:hypothetical protein
MVLTPRSLASLDVDLETELQKYYPSTSGGSTRKHSTVAKYVKKGDINFFTIPIITNED